MEIEQSLATHITAVTGVARVSRPAIEATATRIAECFGRGGKLLACGNGGSAADAQHFVAEFVNRMRFDRPPLPAIALSTDASVLTSIANDARYGDVFARQVLALGSAGDVLVCFSTSGRSANVLAALEAASQVGLTTVGFTGRSGAAVMGPLCSILLAVPSDDTPRIQEAHEFAYHVIAEAVERSMFGAESPLPAPE